MTDILDDKLAAALCEGRFLVNLNNLCNHPIRTGIQRVCYEFWQRWPYREQSIPFVEIDADTIGLLDPSVLEDVRALFDHTDSVLEAFKAEHPEMRMEPSKGWLGLTSARNRIVTCIKVKPALDACRAVVALEESLNNNFFDLAAQYRPEKIMHLCHDFLVWTHSEHFNVDWNAADNIAQSLVNRRRYPHNFFTSTMTRDVYTQRINAGDTRHYWVIPPGADAFGRSYRDHVPDSTEFVVVGTLEPRKQPIQILEAFEKINKDGPKAELCFAGRMGWLAPSDKARLEKAFKTYPWLRWVDGPDDSELRSLILDARATIYLSLAEGFGSPPVESLALGVPCIVSESIPSVVDMAANGQLRIAPDEPDALLQAVEDLLDDQVLQKRQEEITTLELPTWHAFVEGIAKMAEENFPSNGLKVAELKYSDVLDVLSALGRFREIPRDAIIRSVGQSLGLKKRDIDQMVGRGVQEVWNNVDTLIALSDLIPDGRLGHAAIAAALADHIPVATLPIPENEDWIEALDTVLSERDYKQFIGSIYSHIHKRNFTQSEVHGQLPRQIEDISRLKLLVDAVGSDEYRGRNFDELRGTVGDAYFDKINNLSQSLRARYLRGLVPNFSVERAMYIADNEQFVRILYQDLTAQSVSKTDLNKWLRAASTFAGRYKVAVEILLRRECLFTVFDPALHHDLVLEATRRSCAYPLVKASGLEMMGRIALAQREKLTSSELVRLFSGRTTGVIDGDLLGAVNHYKSTDQRIAFLVTWAMVAGYAEWVAPVLQWASAQAGMEEVRTRNASSGLSSHAVMAFYQCYGREASVAEASIIATASSDIVGVAAVIAASTRLDMKIDLLAVGAWVLVQNEAIVQASEQIEVLSRELMLACPPLKSVTFKSGPEITETLVLGDERELEASGNIFGEIISVRDLLALGGTEFVSAAYRKILLREVDATGMATYLKLMETSRGKEGVIYSLATSDEGKVKGVTFPGLAELLQNNIAKTKKKKFGLKKLLRIMSGNNKSRK